MVTLSPEVLPHLGSGRSCAWPGVAHSLSMACRPLPEPAVELPSFTGREDSTALQDPSWGWGDPNSRTDGQTSPMSGPARIPTILRVPSLYVVPLVPPQNPRPHTPLHTSRPLPRRTCSLTPIPTCWTLPFSDPPPYTDLLASAHPQPHLGLSFPGHPRL